MTVYGVVDCKVVCGDCYKVRELSFINQFFFQSIRSVVIHSIHSCSPIVFLINSEDRIYMNYNNSCTRILRGEGGFKIPVITFGGFVLSGDTSTIKR